MTQAFADNDAGDETRRYADYVGSDAAEALYPGEAVDVTGAGSEGPEVTRHADGNQAFGVVWKGADAAGVGNATVKTHGSMIARVTSNAVVGGTVGSHAGTDTDWSAGDLSNDGDEYLVLDTGAKTNPRSGSDDQYAEVLKL